MITVAQIKAARCLLGWRQSDLAKHSEVSEISIKNIERGATDPRISTASKIKDALEEGGICFLPEENGEGPGVRLRKA